MTRRRLFRLLLVTIVTWWSGSTFGDDASRRAVGADPAQLAALKLQVGGGAYVPTGAGVVVAIDESLMAGNGTTQLNPPNNNMPNAAQVTINTPAIGVSSHATMVTGIVVAPATGVAPQATIFQAAAGNDFGNITTSTACLCASRRIKSVN